MTDIWEPIELGDISTPSGVARLRVIGAIASRCGSEREVA